jgi:leader peptidase (prepilin peptidase)/N-methyltransferase
MIFAGELPGTSVLAAAAGRPVAVLLGAVVGGAAGGLVPLPAYRLSVPWGKPPRTACERCDAALPDGDRGWLRWGGRCASCGVRLGPRSGLVAAVGAVSGAALGWRLGLDVALVPFLALTAAGLLLGAIDLSCQRLPTAIIWPVTATGAALLAIAAQVDGRQPAMTRAILAALVLGGAYLLLALLPGANLGLGDVRLAAALGLHLGWLGWVEAVGGVVLLPFLLNAPVALALLVSGRASRRSTVPFGPAMLAGAVVGAVGWYAVVLATAR